MEAGKIRVLLTKSELDAHDRGVRTIAAALRDAGFEVIFTRFLMPEEIVKTALEEDVDVIGISSSIGGHMVIASEVMNLIKKNNLSHITVILGGIIPNDDIPQLLQLGIAKTFGPGTSPNAVADYLISKVTRAS
jgi:methylmalonyl-CoA mutase C-terminal domain/subunit